MYKTVVIEDIPIHMRGKLHVARMSSDKSNIVDIPGGTHARDGRLQQRNIAKAISMSGKTSGVRNLQMATQGALDKRILRSVNIEKPILAHNSRKG